MARNFHGLTKHPLYSMYRTMLTRCRNPKSKSYKNYGGRGITVCDRWLNFGNFVADMGPTWKKGLTIEREDNDKGYEPGNCSWVPRQDQAKNRRFCTHIETPNGRMTISEAAGKFGISFFALRNRVRKNWPADQLLRPPAPGGRTKGEGCTSPRGVPSP